ncbi:hypothetical protein Hanom_Chr06g00526561 [Helianthus anomalus]
MLHIITSPIRRVTIQLHIHVGHCHIAVCHNLLLDLLLNLADPFLDVAIMFQ